MPADRLGEAIKQLRRDARRAPCEKPREPESKEAEEEVSFPSALFPATGWSQPGRL
jgi:hypothetical protein